jgi:hypothetical protein
MKCNFKYSNSRSRISDDITENKSHPDHIQADSNGFAGSNGRVLGASPMHKTSRLNGVVSRMNITPNPLAQDGDKVNYVMIDKSISV